MNVNVAKDRLDQTISLVREGYAFIPNRLHSQHLDVYETKLLGQRIALIGGEEGANLFYDSSRMKRNGALPKPVLKTLFGEGGVHTKDGAAHAHRKQLFMSLMTPDALRRLSNLTTAYWEEYAMKWEKQRKVVLYDESRELLCQVACDWAGIPLGKKEVEQRTEDLSKMIDGFSALGPKHIESRRARNRSEKWIRSIIEDVRANKLETREGSAIHEMAFHLDENGDRLDTEIAAVELLNVIRPLVAISKFLAFGAKAYADYPETREKTKESDEYILRFAQEVRRYYPFAPFLGAKVKHDFTWQGYTFRENQLVMIDLFGTNHDPRLWENPDQFDPDRFKDWKGGLFDLIPQGGGDYYDGHRCPGEWPTIEVLKASFGYLSRKIDYKVPKQDHSYSLSKMPALPKSGMILKKVRRK
ncbi:cytochrome P450 [Pontibacillus halophilus JSM 076056 = DSM 19796]|uniref:Cytochrome P450 n=1 Tax=Pontibacillus halophilus JSM 076056 = DSM 19796 TaxID=1385510 RepID=A0A0A5IB28_9BACI|nr:cytochrome P450 [Pontibacillus halophilus]KGX93017.1 cytochrome P450 [Pontibacillus halophilus JSM 076056 = DSM 19796]